MSSKYYRDIPNLDPKDIMRAKSITKIFLSLMVAMGSSNSFAAADSATYYFRHTSSGGLGPGGVETPAENPSNTTTSVSFAGNRGETFQQSLSANGFSDWTILDRNLPAGLDFDLGTLTFSGTPLETGSNYSVRLFGKNAANGNTLTISVKITITAPIDPTAPQPDIADQSKTILGTQGTLIADWVPVGGVVDKNTQTVWTEEGTKFTASVDLGQYGLTFDETSGRISGTPTAPFIIPDFTVTVKSNAGNSDATAPFWIGAAPSQPLKVDDAQEGVYVFRLNKPFTTNPVVVENSIGKLEFSRPPELNSGWNAATGVWALNISDAPESWINAPTNHTTTITDEFNRTLAWSFITDFAPQVVASAPSSIAYIGTTYTDEKPLLKTAATGVQGVASWTASGIPSGLSFDGDNGVLKGLLPEGSFADGEQFTIPLTVVDSFDGDSAATTALITARLAEFVAVNVFGDTQTIKAWGQQPTLKTVLRYRDDNTDYAPGATWKLVSGTIPDGITTSTPDDSGLMEGVAYTGYATTPGTYGNIVWQAINPSGQEILTKPVTLVVSARDPLQLAADPGKDSLFTRQDPVSIKVTAVNNAAAKPIAAANWKVTGNLPNGVNYAVVDDHLELSGAANDVGTFTATVTAIDEAGGNASLALTFTINPATDGVASAGGGHTCSLTTGGGVKCWGLNTSGQLGNGTFSNSTGLVDVTGLASDVKSISTGDGYTCALTKTGGVKCWGLNTSGQLGDGTTTNSNVPVDVVGLTSGVAAVSAGYTSTCAVTNTGSVKCWGNNLYGQLGNNSSSNTTAPVQVAGLEAGATSVTTGFHHACALTSAGGVKCWGLNVYGALGNNTTANSSVPVDVQGLASGATGIQGGYRHTCATTSAGGVKCWGYNNVGQLGTGNTVNSSVPLNVLNISNVIQMSMSDGHACSVTSDGKTYCWGYNQYGAIGDNTQTNRSTPTLVGTLSGVTSITAGARHSCASLNTGTLKCWGLNGNGQLGDNTTVNKLVPVTVSGT